jgi:hypothetical protein
MAQINLQQLNGVKRKVAKRLPEGDIKVERPRARPGMKHPRSAESPCVTSTEKAKSG